MPNRWIWHAEALNLPQCAIVARKRFRLPARPRHALLDLCASHVYRLHVNGVLVGRGPDRADPRHLRYDTLDLTPHLRRGANVLLVELHHRRAPDAKDRCWCLYGGPPGFWARLRGGGVTLTTDASWRVRLMPGWLQHDQVISRFLGYQHHVDLGAARQLSGWHKPIDEDGHWSRPVLLAMSRRHLPAPQPRSTPMLQRLERQPIGVGYASSGEGVIANAREFLRHLDQAPTVIQPSATATTVTFDFGRTVAGFPIIELSTRSGGGRVDLAMADGTQFRLCDRLLLPARGAVRYEPLDWRGGRYLQLQFTELQGPVRINAVRFADYVYPYDRRAAFACSDESITQLWSICRDTIDICTRDHPQDCVTREQALWLEDLCIHTPGMLACFGDPRPAAKGIEQALEVMHDDGVVPVPGPVGLGYRRSEAVLPWSGQPTAIAAILRELYTWSGDAAPIRRAWPKLLRIAEHYRRYEDDDGLLRLDPPGLPRLIAYLANNPSLVFNGISTGFNFQYLRWLGAMADLAGAIRHEREARAFARAAKQRLAVLQRKFWDRRRHLYVDGHDGKRRLTSVSLTANAYAALAGGVPATEIGAWAHALSDEATVLPPTSPMDAAMLLWALVELDLPLQARALLDDYFGSIVRAGLPHLPEFWSGRDATSLQWHEDFSRCHAYGSTPAFLLHRHVLGVRATQPGWSRVSIAPRPLGLSNATGRVLTPHGDIEVQWSLRDLAWDLRITLPASITATLTLPRRNHAREELCVNGRRVWQADFDPTRRAIWALQPDPVPRTINHELRGGGSYDIALRAW